MWDAIIIGAGFYGCVIATHLRSKGLSVVVVEAADKPMMRASLINQARIHQGYHYPRDFTTAYRSSQSFSRFIDAYKDSVVDDFTQIYAVASRGSHVSARQFMSMMGSVGAPFSGAGRKHASLFSPNLVDAVFETREFAFDAVQLSRTVMEKALEAGVVFRFGEPVVSVEQTENGVLVNAGEILRAPRVFNCTYGRLHMLHPGGIRRRLKYEICEMCLVSPPPVLTKVGITIMDGPFWSCMPYPSRNLHSLSHVRYTPRLSWIAQEQPERDPYKELDNMHIESSFIRMRDDASRFVPVMREAVYEGTMKEIKTVLVSNEEGDGRPILIEGSLKEGVVSILGGKLDNVFDILERMDS